jgi:hypothetical protein
MVPELITDLPAIGAVDRAVDLIEMVDISTNTSTKTTINHMLGITGAPLSDVDPQLIANKTIDATNVFTIKDTNLTLVDNVDPTKAAQFDLSNLSAGATRTYKLPDASGTLVDTNSTQTLNAKTLIGPVITNPTINNPNLNTDAISPFTTGSGVTIDGLNIKSGVLNTNNSVVTANITDGNVTPNKLVAGAGNSWDYQDWTPTYTGLTVGNGQSFAKYSQVGKTVDAHLAFIMGTTSVVTGTVLFSLPVTAADYGFSLQTFNPIGMGWLDDSGVTNYPLYIVFGSLTTAGILTYKTDLTWASGFQGVNASTPFAVGVGDHWHISFRYQAA